MEKIRSEEKVVRECPANSASFFYLSKLSPVMEIETGPIDNSITIPLNASDESIQIFVDELEDDPSSLISLLFDECVPLKYWIQIAVRSKE